MFNENFAKTLKRLRLSSGLTADEVGAKIGKSGKTVNGWENGRSQPDCDTFLKLCNIYKVKDIMQEFEYKTVTTESFDLQKEQLIKNYALLNEQGKSKLVEYSDDLLTSGKYTQEEKEKRA